MNLEGERDRSLAYIKDEDGLLLRDIELIHERWVQCVWVTYWIATCRGIGLDMYLKKNQNAPRPSEHPPVREEKCQNV